MNSLNKVRIGWRSSTTVQVFNSLAKQSSSESKQKIVIPNRIPRGPTDILRALAATVQRDTTAAHYKYHDDPFLIPMSNPGKRTFAMAKEAGRKAAHWIQTRHSKLFQHQVADPPIKDFMPRVIYDEKSEVDEETLKRVIEDVAVNDAITVYHLLEKQGTDVSQATKQMLLELLCFYNGEDTIPEDLVEERWFRQGSKGREKHRKTWKDNGLAETVFKSLEPHEPAAYCALLQGMTKYCQVDRAWQLYQETLDKGVPLTTETYNSLFRVVNFLRESTELRWSLIQELMTAMSKQGLQPTVGTLNSVLEAISSMSPRQGRLYVMSIMAEFKQLKIEPSLASYYYLLIIFCKDRGPVSDILVEIMNLIEGQHFVIQDTKDIFFFVTAMDVCHNHLQDKDLAYRVDRLLHTGSNYNLIGDSFKESIYYRHFFTLMCSMEPLDTFMALYNKLVPHIYIPEPRVMEEVIKAIDLNGAMEHLPRIWTDMVVFDHTERENLIVALLDSMVKNQPLDGSELAEQFGKVAWDIWTRLEEAEMADRYRQLSWTGGMLGNVLILSLRASSFEKACQVLNKLVKAQHTVVGLPNIEALLYFLDACIELKAVNKAVACIEYTADAGFPEAGKMAQQLRNALPLDAGIIAKLTNMVGKDAMKVQEEPTAASNG